MSVQSKNKRDLCNWLFYNASRYISGPLLLCLTGVRHYNVPRTEELEGALLASNHQSFLDPILIGMMLEKRIHYLARSGLFEIPVLDKLITSLQAHPIKRGQTDPRALKAMMKLLKRREPLLLFPEGTRTFDGSIGEFQEGVGAIAIRCDVRIIPVCIEGSFRSWPRGRFLPGPARIGVYYGDPFQVETDDKEELVADLKGKIVAMQKKLRNYLYGNN